MSEKSFEREADLVACFGDIIAKSQREPLWTLYHETAGWDVLCVGPRGVQVGIEAKLSLNAKVLEQALPGRWADLTGPDYRAVLVPAEGCQLHLTRIAKHLGIVIVRCWPARRGYVTAPQISPALPDETWDWGIEDWPNWCPAQRCKLPDYVPDVTGGHSAPVQLTAWKVKAIKLLILLERNGAVTRHDMKVLQISPTRWTDHYHGFLAADPVKGGYTRSGRTPDLKAQHPKNWAEIEADFDKWSAGLSSPAMFGSAA